MDLPTNFAAPFTRWVVASGLLKSRFVLVDVGVQGGPHRRWEALGDMLEVHGFDALREAIEPLTARGTPHHRYYNVALGGAEGTATLHIAPDPCGSSLYDHSDNRPSREVPVRTLDSFLAQGQVPPFDFIKIDCEGYEPNVLKGAGAALARSPVVGAEIETNFNISPHFPKTHFCATYRPLLDRGLLLFDAVFDRHPRPSFPGSRSRSRPSSWDIMLARDLLMERDNYGGYAARPADATTDEVLKSAIVFELYEMLDVAFDVIHGYRNELAPVIDVPHVLDLLARQPVAETPPA